MLQESGTLLTAIHATLCNPNLHFKVSPRFAGLEIVAYHVYNRAYLFSS